MIINNFIIASWAYFQQVGCLPTTAVRVRMRELAGDQS